MPVASVSFVLTWMMVMFRTRVVFAGQGDLEFLIVGRVGEYA